MQRLMTQWVRSYLLLSVVLCLVLRERKAFQSLVVFECDHTFSQCCFFSLVMRERKSFRSLIVFEYMLQLMTKPLGGFDLCWGHVM
jgi:hypothetical protein